MKPKSPSYYALKYGIVELKKRLEYLEWLAGKEFDKASKKLKEARKIVNSIKL